MKNIKGIEGDYIETKEDNLFFDVKGIFHPNDRKICYLRFYSHPEGDRKNKGVPFKKIYNLNERNSLIRTKYPQYLYYSKELDFEVQSVKNQDIKKIHSPRDFLRNLTKKETLSTLEQNSKSLCELIINKSGISKELIGITGSTMVGLDSSDSDIDIIIYGTEPSLVFQKELKKLLKASNKLRKYNLNEYKSHYKWRVGGSDISFKDFMKSEQRKLHQGKYENYDFFIRYIKSPKDWRGDFYDYHYKNYGRISLKACILDSKDSIFTPCSYKIKPLKVLDEKLISNKIELKDILEVNSFRARFCEHAKEGEIVLVEGKLEKVNYKNSIEYYRILLTDQTIDKMLILN